MKIFLTSDLGLEGASDDVVRTAVFDGDEIVARSHWGVCDPVALGALHTVHLHLGGPVDGHSQSAWACLACIHNKFTCGSWR